MAIWRVRKLVSNDIVIIAKTSGLEAVRNLCTSAFGAFKHENAVDAPCIGLVSINHTHKNHSAKHSNVVNVPIRWGKRLASRPLQRITRIMLNSNFPIGRTYANRRLDCTIKQ